MGAAGKAGGGILGKALIAGFAAAGVAAGIGKGLYEVGQVFNDMKNTIIVGTGASGAALEGLQKSAENIGRSTPSSFGDIGTAVADLNTRLGLTGKPLETMSTNMLNLSRITKTDLGGNIEDLTRVFGDWGIAVADQPAALDKVFYASQATGAGIGDLAQSVVRMGAPLRQFGFSFEEGLAIFGKWEKEGVNAQTVMAGLKIGLGQFSKAGLEPKKALEDVQKAIMGAGSAGEANQIAIKAFGQRAGPDMAAAVLEGRFAIDDLVKGIQGSKGAIDDADKRTRTFSESWQVFKNQVLLKLQPVAEKVFQGFTDFAADTLPKVSAGFDSVASVVGPFIADFRNGVGVGGQFAAALERTAAGLLAVGTFIMNNKAAVGTFVGIIATGVVVAKAFAAAQVLVNLALSANPIGIVVVAIAALVAGLVYAYKHSDRFRKIVDATFGFIGKYVPKIVSAVVGFVKNHWKLLVGIIGGPVVIVALLVHKHFGTIKAVVGAVATFVVNSAKKYAEFATAVGQNIGKALKFFKDLPGKIRGFVSGIPDQLRILGGAIVDGLKRGIEAAAYKVLAAVQSLINKIPKKIRDIMGISSPSKVTTYFGRMIGEGLARGIDSTADKVSKATEKLIDKLKSQLDGLKSDFASLKDSIAGAFTGNLFEATTAGEFIANLTSTKGQLTALKAAFKKLVGWGLKPEFLSQLFQSGNGGLILDLAAGSQAQAAEAGSLFSQVGSLSSSLGAGVADLKFGDKIDQTNKKLDRLTKAVERVGVDVGREINGAARSGHRRGKAA